MIDIIIIAALVIGFLVGLKRGLILQIIRLISLLVAYFVAYSYSATFASTLKSIISYPLKISSVYIEGAFYRVAAFIILFFLTLVALSVLGHVLNVFAQIPVLKQANQLGGGILGFVEVYILLFVLILVGNILPIQEVQTTLHQSSLSKVIANDTPVLSSKVKHLWSSGIKA